ncbi:FecR family protein [Chitinophaga defluvii]|uniref:FecR domain-containing protein n=1 Tax=Chitinophaga defluvii TaxID=3163343 RepID=A0ABV2TBE8_9BACT
MTDHLSSRQEDGLPFRFRPKSVSKEQTAASWRQITTGMQQHTPGRPGRERKWLVALTVFTVLIAGGWMVWLMGLSEKMVEIRTTYGEIREVQLPDSSVVYMNANSVLRMPEQWTADGARKVWLEGEAYFEISKQPGRPQNQFIVHTDQLDVVVLGTKFNVNISTNKTTVSLKEGKVQLTAKEDVPEGQQVITLNPGDEAQIGRKTSFVKACTNVDLIAGWRNNRYHFEGTSLAEITELIRNKYGYEVVISDTSLNSRSITGDLYAGDIDQFTKALSITMKLQIEKKGQQLIFRSKK